jgi:hypothetical protein
MIVEKKSEYLSAKKIKANIYFISLFKLSLPFTGKISIYLINLLVPKKGSSAGDLKFKCEINKIIYILKKEIHIKFLLCPCFDYN